MFDMSPSGWYAWLKRPPSPQARDETRLEVEIRAAHQRTRETYGPERLQQDLAEPGGRVGVHRIKRIRKKKLGLRCKQKRTFQATTDSQHGWPVAENLWDQDFATTQAPNEVWLSDLTYIPTGEGWLSLVGHKDLFTGAIVGYARGDRMTTALVSQSLWRAVSTRRPGPSSTVCYPARGHRGHHGMDRTLLQPPTAPSPIRLSVARRLCPPVLSKPAGGLIFGVHYCQPTSHLPTAGQAEGDQQLAVEVSRGFRLIEDFLYTDSSAARRDRPFNDIAFSVT